MALPIGVVFAIARLSSLRFLNYLMQFYIWVFRGTPLLLQLLFIYYGLGIVGIKITLLSSSVVFCAQLFCLPTGNIPGGYSIHRSGAV